jgi:ribosome-interacting GTPase 1
MTDDYDIDDLVDIIEGSRVYIPCIYVVNKIDQITLEELQVRRPPVPRLWVPVYTRLVPCRCALK